jgi:hypothetical protein
MNSTIGGAMYLPSIESAHVVKRYRCSFWDIELLDDIVASGLVEYNYLMVVQSSEVILTVSSERGITGDTFLCVFDEDGHHNFGADDRWNDVKEFEAAALEIVGKRVGVVAVALDRV